MAKQKNKALQFWQERLIAVLIPLFVICALIFIFFYGFHVSFINRPPENVEFVQELREKVKKSTTDKTVSLDKPHRTDKELKKLITQSVSESLSFNRGNFSNVMKKMRVYFSEDGFQKYKKYLLSSGIAETIRTNDYDVSVYIESEPLYLNGMVIDGVYKWLYQMPVTLSFFPTGKAITAENSQQQINNQFNLRVQVTRAQVDNFTEALQIEDWVVSPR